MMKKLIFFTVVLIGLYSCNGQLAAQDDLSMNLVETLLANEKIKKITEDGKPLVISTRGYCATNDCAAYFKSADQQIELRTKEDVFMRKMKHFIEIEDLKVEPDNTYMKVIIRSEFGRKSEKVIL